VTATDYSELPPALRAAAYRNLAADARREASTCKGHLRESFMLIAMQWERLAAEAVASIKPET
jgi:hypothetical protein